MTNVILFSEDVLIEQAARKIIAVENPQLNISNVMGKRGFSYFQTRLPEIRRSANSLKFLVFLDGDELGQTCPSDAINDWFQTRHPNNVHIRFALHEVESWLLADSGNLAGFLNIPGGAIPAVNDDSRDTKELLIQLARQSRSRDVVSDLVPRAGFTSVVGPAYNARVTEFIQKAWDVRAAASRNNSLARACRAIAGLR
jgi:hypothetical protein